MTWASPPATYDEAMRRSDASRWRTTMDKEMGLLCEMKIPGHDFGRTFAPVACQPLICVIAAHCAKED